MAHGVMPVLMSLALTDKINITERFRMMALALIKEALREGPYAWPGGHPKYFVTMDGAALSFDAVRSNWREVVYAHLTDDRCSGWAIASCEVNWEQPDLRCDHTGAFIPSAYDND